MLKFFARGTAMCPRFDTPTLRRFAGRSFDPKINGWPKLREPLEIEEGSEAAAEYVLACQRGDLWPADEATAKACDVKFDSNFGGDEELASKADEPVAPTPSPSPAPAAPTTNGDEIVTPTTEKD